jgi:hypothetical protein
LRRPGAMKATGLVLGFRLRELQHARPA